VDQTLKGAQSLENRTSIESIDSNDMKEQFDEDSKD
jgi:hypothetical protein